MTTRTKPPAPTKNALALAVLDAQREFEETRAIVDVYAQARNLLAMVDPALTAAVDVQLEAAKRARHTASNTLRAAREALAVTADA